MIGAPLPPRATMRLQFNGEFTFHDAARHADYFAALGISHLYASPILKAHSASTHGYDLVDPTLVDPRLGGIAGLRDLVAELRRHDMGLIVDIVPNHMAVNGGQNPWWQDILANGMASRYARFFDIDWDSPDPSLRGRVLLPILGEPVQAAIDKGDLGLSHDRACPTIRYHDLRLPIRADDLSHARDRPLSDLLDRQHYVLAPWTEAATRINWRRFFDINELAALRIEDADVFEATHRYLFELYEEGLVDGFRVDHVDGLADPGAYCRRLESRLAGIAPRRPSGLQSRAYLVVEKILAYREPLPAWPVAGTTGYDFMNEVSAWLHQETGAKRLNDLWQELTQDRRCFAEIDRSARGEILCKNFLADLQRCARQFRLEFPGRPSLSSLTEALREIVSVMPAYRTYLGSTTVEPHDQAIVTDVRRSLPATSAGIAEAMCIYLAGTPISPALQPAVTRFQQLSATIVAKGTEDTAFYRYGAMLSRNEVGSSPDLLSIPTSDLHACAAARADHHPAAMLATATHDTKRGEDARARLAILSELADEWAEHVKSWLRPGADAPHPADQLMLFQALVGAWPMDAQAPVSEAFIARVARWQRKCLREGKLRSSWSAPDESYEATCESFLRRLLAEQRADIAAFVARIAPAGVVNSLCQLVLKLTMPGVPDFYQGGDLWDLSLVDPDNRGAVDFDHRTRLAQQSTLPAPLLAHWRTGEVKQAVIARLLDLRRRLPEVFARGAYRPIEIEGPLASHALAFSRVDRTGIVTVVTTRHPANLLAGSDLPVVPASAWRDTRLRVRDPVAMTDLLSERRVRADGDTLFVSELLRDMPAAILSSAALE